PVSGQPALKSSHATVEPFPAMLYGFAVSQTPMPTRVGDYWASAVVAGGHALEFACLDRPANVRAIAANLLGRNDLIGAVDEAAGTARYAAFDGPVLNGAVFLAPDPVAVSRSFVTRQLGEAVTGQAVLAGRPGAGVADPGPIICACFHVGANTIDRAIEDGASTLDTIGDVLGAGTNCGSCRAEIARLIADRTSLASGQGAAASDAASTAIRHTEITGDDDMRETCETAV
ncbi:MAG: (2Fe-2S)-binding protein, partial [Pseudomonadota bacterium]